MRRGARGTDNRGGESHGPGHAPTSSGVPVKLIVLAGLLVVAAFPVVAMLRTHTSPHTPPAPPAALSPSQRSMNMRGAAAGSAAGPGAGTASPSAGSNVRTPPAVGTPPTLSWPSSDGRADTVAQLDAPAASSPSGVAVDVVIPETAGGSAAESGSTAVDDETGTQVVSPVDSASSDSAAVSVDVPRRDNPVAKRVSPADPFVPLIEPLPQDIDKLVETCALFTDEVKAMHKVLAGEDVAKCGSMKGGSTGAKVQITLKDGTKTVFRPLRCDNYVRCPNFVAEVIAAHVAVIMGLPNRVPPVVFRKVDYAWLDSNCGGVKVRPPPGQRKKKKKKKNAGSRKLLALPSGSGDDVNVGAVGGARVGRHLTGLMKRAVDVEKDGTVLGAMQVMWNNIKTSKDVGAKFKPGRSPWIEWANDPNYKVNGFEASKWSEWADLLTFDHIMDNYDRSRDYALWKNVHWEKKGDTARVVYIDQNSCLAQRRFSRTDKNKFYGLCRFRRSMVTRLRQLKGRLGQLTYRSVRNCDPYPEHVSLLSGMTKEEAMYVYDDLDSRLETALGIVDQCIEKHGEDLVLSLP